MRKDLKIIIACCWLSVSFQAHGQEVTFISPVVEEGIRQHLKIGGGEAISFLQLDTITSLDLSKRGVTDIRDLELLHKLRTLDLRDNNVLDLQPLAVLDSLEWVDLSHNSLKGINDLFYSTSKKMTVNVAFNYIKVFSIFGSLTHCNFTLEGTGLQLIEDAPYFDVCQLLCDASVNPAVLQGLIQTNMSESVRVECEEHETEVPSGSDGFTIALQGDFTKTVPVFLGNGVIRDSTYLVPQTFRALQPNRTVRIATSLPDDYTIRVCSPVQQGSIQVEGTNLIYTAAPSFDYEDIIISYYWGPVLKGFSKLQLSSDVPTDITKMKEGNEKLMLASLGSGRILVDCQAFMGKGPAEIRIYDMAGTLIESIRSESKDGIHQEIQLNHVSGKVIVVQVTSGGFSYVGKILID